MYFIVLELFSGGRVEVRSMITVLKQESISTCHCFGALQWRSKTFSSYILLADTDLDSLSLRPSHQPHDHDAAGGASELCSLIALLCDLFKQSAHQN